MRIISANKRITYSNSTPCHWQQKSGKELRLPGVRASGKRRVPIEGNGLCSWGHTSGDFVQGVDRGVK